MARKAVSQELSRDRIINVARDLFATQGYRQVSMRGIGNALGYSHGALYYHFKEKAELFYAIIMEDFSLLSHRLHEALAPTVTDAISNVELVLLEFIRFGMKYPHHYEIMFLINDPEVLTYAKPERLRCFEQFSSVLRKAAHLSGFAHPLEHTPWQLFLSIHGFITYYIHAQHAYEEVSKKAEEHVRFICRNLSREPAFSATSQGA